MSDQNSILKILSDLNVIGSLSPGKTLSTTSMQIIDHNSWTGSIWRRYTGENRAGTIEKIKGILNEAIFVLETSPSSELETSLHKALTGFESLIETYGGDYYTQNKIQNTLDTINDRIINNKLLVHDTEHTAKIDELIATVVREQLELAVDQPFRIHSRSDSAVQSADDSRSATINNFNTANVLNVLKELESNIEATIEVSKVSQKLSTEMLVEASDRTSDSSTNKATIVSLDAGCSTKITTDMSGSDTGDVTKNAVELRRGRSMKEKNKSDIIQRNERLQKLSHSTYKSNRNSRNLKPEVLHR